MWWLTFALRGSATATTNWCPSTVGGPKGAPFYTSGRGHWDMDWTASSAFGNGGKMTSHSDLHDVPRGQLYSGLYHPGFIQVALSVSVLLCSIPHVLFR